jgi:ABC-2 type transport system permease protein
MRTIGWARGAIEIRQFMRQRESVVFTLMFPVLLLLIFGSVFSTTIAPGVTFSQYFVAGMIASGLVNSGFQGLAIAIPIERDDGTLKRLRGTPMPAMAYFIGKVILVVVMTLAQIAMLLLIGVLLFHVQLPTDYMRWVDLAWITALGSAVSTLLGIAFSSVPKSGRSASAVVTPIVLVLQFTSGVFFIFNQLPKWMQDIASIFPLRWMTQGMRSVFLPESFASQEVGHSWELGKVAVILGTWLIIGLVLAVKTFKWERDR